MKQVPHLSVVLPAYNEEENIARTVADVVAYLESRHPSYEILIVNDGSRDATGDIANRLAREHPKVRALHHEVNRGYGAALRTGFDAARGELVFFMDSDGQFSIRELPLLLERVGDVDAVLGYRLARQDPWVRRVNAYAWNMLVRALFGLKVRDVDCAFKVLRTSALRSLDLQSEGALINTELLVKMKLAGMRWVQVGVHHYPRLHGRSTGGDLRVILRAFRELWELKQRLRGWHVVAADEARWGS